VQPGVSPNHSQGAFASFPSLLLCFALVQWPFFHM
jgi:hypothetical protein